MSHPKHSWGKALIDFFASLRLAQLRGVKIHAHETQDYPSANFAES